MKSRLILIAVLLFVTSNSYAQKGFQFGVGAGNLFLTPGTSPKDNIMREYVFYKNHVTTPGEYIDLYRIKGKDPFYIDAELGYGFKYWAVSLGFEYRFRIFQLYSYSTDDSYQPIHKGTYQNNTPIEMLSLSYSIPLKFSTRIPVLQNKYALDLIPFLGLSWDGYGLTHSQTDRGYRNIGIGSSDPDRELKGRINFHPGYYHIGQGGASFRIGAGLERDLKKAGRIQVNIEWIQPADRGAHYANNLNDDYPSYLIDMSWFDKEGSNVEYTVDKSRFYLNQQGLKIGLRYYFGKFEMNQ